MHLAIVMPPMASMPLVNGGGVERLCSLFLRENERSADPIDITVISRYDADSEKLAAGYPHAKFLYVKIARSEPPMNELMTKLTGIPMRRDYLNGVIKHLKNADFDTLMLENCPEFTVKLAKKFKIKPILHTHGRFWGTDKIGWKKILPRAKSFIFVSDYLREDALKCGVPKERSYTVMNCVDTMEFHRERFTDIRQEKRAQYELTDNDLLGIFVGRLTPEKGALELVKALSHSEYSDSRLRLLIVGSAQYGMNIMDDYRTELEVAAAKGRVIFIGSVKSASTARFLARADFAVIPSVWNEPAGLPVLEALSSGLPIIVTDSGGIPEYTKGLDESVCTTVKRGIGFVGSLTQAIDKLAARLNSHPEAREVIAKAAREHASAFDVGEYYVNMRKNIE